jgi:lipopolysaccharide biosynthesis glycosyltransferase
MTTQTIDIAFGFDANYAPHAAGVMASVVHHAPDAKFRFLILHDGLADALRTRVEAAAPRAEFVWLQLGEGDLPAYAGQGYINHSTLFRLGLEKLAPADCGRVLYLDADLGVAGDVRPLWAADLGGRPIGAVIDAYIEPESLAARWDLPEGGRYFNAGILVIDLEHVRRERLFSRAVDFIAKNGADLPYNDQDALNWAFWNNWRELDVAWNVQRFMAFPEIDRTLPQDRQLGARAPQIVHFMGADKPWMKQVWHPWAWLYWDGVRRTSFFSELSSKVGRWRIGRAWLRWLSRSLRLRLRQLAN